MPQQIIKYKKTFLRTFDYFTFIVFFYNNFLVFLQYILTNNTTLLMFSSVDIVRCNFSNFYILKTYLLRSCTVQYAKHFFFHLERFLEHFEFLIELKT